MNPKILIVDDSKTSIKSLELIIKDINQNLITVNSAYGALEILVKDNDFALALLDVNMPEMDGYELAEVMRGDPTTKNIPIIFITASHSDTHHIIKGFNSGAVDFISKPPNPQILTSKVKIFMELYSQKKDLQLYNNTLQELVAERTEELLYAKQYAENITLSMTDALFVVDSDSAIKTINPAVSTLFGYDENELIGKSIESLFKHGDKDDMTNEKIMVRKDGKEIIVLLSGGLFKDEIKKKNKVQGDRMNSKVLVVKDISELKKSQEALKKRNDQLAHSERLAAVGEVSAGVAHELNQPLTVISSEAQVLQLTKNSGKEISSDKLDKSLSQILRQVDRATKITDNMRAFVRTDSHNLFPIQLAGPIDLAMDFYRKRFSHNGISLTEEIDPAVQSVKADEQKFQQVVINFLSNAQYAVEKKKENAPDDYSMGIKVRLFSQDSLVIFELEDNGIGMNKDTSVKFMNPFFTTKEVGKGTGLGMGIVKRILDEFDAKLSVVSEENVGTTMRVEFGN